MAIKKGQNIRVLIPFGTKYRVVAKSTNCTVTLTGNTDDASTKDDVGMATKPVITSKSWSVQVESLDVTDVSAMLTAISNAMPFTLVWDEVSSSDNQTPQAATLARMGTAYLNDATFQWDDRANSTKQLQFTGSGPLTKLTDPVSIDTVTVDGAYTKGQFVRLFLGSDNSTVPSKVVAAAKSLSLHVSATMESATTKDTQDITGDWDVQSVTGVSFDISSGALVGSNDVITSSVEGQDFASLQDIYEAAAPVRFQIANVNGLNNRTKSLVICSGSVVITQLTLNAPNRQNATYSATLTGYGALNASA